MKSVLSIFVMAFMLIQPAHSQTTVELTLAGYNQVPPVRTPASGTVEITVEGDSLFVKGEFSDLREYYRGAYIHYGKEGETGNRMYQLNTDLNEDKVSGEFKSEKNRFYLREAQKEALRNGRLYVNITSNRYRGGELRVQIPPIY